MIVIGQGADRLLSGEMSLYELQMLVVGQNNIVKAQSGGSGVSYDGPSHWTPEQWEENELEVQRVLKSAEKSKE